MMATVPDVTPACSQAVSNGAPAGFHSSALGLAGSGAVAADRAGQDDPLSPRRVRLLLVGIAAVHDQVGAIQRRVEEALVALELQLVRHDVLRIRQHAVGGDDDIAVDAQRHGDGGVYSETVVTTLETGRELTVGSLRSLMTSSSYFAMTCTGALARIATTL